MELPKYGIAEALAEWIRFVHPLVGVNDPNEEVLTISEDGKELIAVPKSSNPRVILVPIGCELRSDEPMTPGDPKEIVFEGATVEYNHPVIDELTDPDHERDAITSEDILNLY